MPSYIEILKPGKEVFPYENNGPQYDSSGKPVLAGGFLGGVTNQINYGNPKGPTNALGIRYGDSDYAAETNAAISRADWERYKEVYQPLEDLLLSRVGNANYRNQQVGLNLGRFNQAFTSSQDSYQRNLKRYGLTLNPAEQSSYNRMLDQSKSLGQVEAINRTTRDIKDQEYSIIGSGTKPQTYNREG